MMAARKATATVPDGPTAATPSSGGRTSSRAPRVSIGLPVYNGERYIGRAIDAIRQQTFDDFELIISDNASTDGTERICRAVAAEDPRIRYVRHPVNVGVTQNFNDVVALARAPYFKWASADDLVAPTLLEQCVDVLDQNPSIVLVHSATRFIDADGADLGEDSGLTVMDDRPSDRLQRMWELLRFCNAQYGVMRTGTLRRTRLFGSYVGSDVCFLVELSLHGKFFELPERLLLRRLHGEAASGLTAEELLDHYGIHRGTLVMYYWRHFVENARSLAGAPIPASEKVRGAARLVRKAVWQRRLLFEEMGFMVKHLTGRPYPVLGTMSRFSRRQSGAPQ